MKFTTGLTIQALGGISPSSLVKISSVIDLKHIEFDISVFKDLPNVIDVLKANQTTIHAPYIEDYGFDLSSKKQEVDQFVEDVIRYQPDLKIIGVVVHPPIDGSGSMENFYNRIEKIPLPLLENMPYQSWNEFLDFFDTTQSNVGKRLGMCFDIPHSYMTHKEMYLNLPDTCLDLLRTSDGYIHISGGTYTEDTHYPLLTEGDMPLDPVKTFLQDINFSGTVTMELAPRNLEEINKLFKSYCLMLGIAGENLLQLKMKLKRPFILWKIRSSLEKKVDANTFSRKSGD